MVVRIRGGYDTESGWPADDSTGVEFQNDVEIPGQFKGGGAGFEYGPGGFFKPGGVPSIVGPSTGAQGTSLSSVPRGGGAPAPGGPDIFAPQRQNLRPGMSPAVRTGPGPSTDATFAPGEPIPGAAPVPWWMSWVRGGPLGAAAAVMNPAQTANDAAPTNMWNQRPSGVGGMPGPQVVNPPFEQPHRVASHPYPLPPESGFPEPSSPMPARPVTPTPATAYPAAPVVSQRTTRSAAGPAAVVQQPNLGNYGASPFTTLDYRPNSGPNERNRGSPVATALDLSRLFGGGQPAPAPAARPAGMLSGDPEIPGRGPAIVPGMNPTGNLALTGGNVRPGEIRSVQVPYPAPRPKKRSSTTSQGGGY